MQTTCHAALPGQRYQTNMSANLPVFPQKRQNKQRTGLELSRTRSELNHPTLQYFSLSTVRSLHQTL